MIKHFPRIEIAIILFLISFGYAQQSFTNSTLGYSAYLPENWQRSAANDSQDVFLDTSGAYPAYLSIVQHSYSNVDFPTGNDWTRANFIAYKMYIDYYPYGTVLYFDSSSTLTQDGLWAAELFIRFFTDDTSNFTWDEYVRYTATNENGYELYAMGDTADMRTNLPVYGAILQSIDILRANMSIQKYVGPIVSYEASFTIKPFERTAVITLNGRRMTELDYLPDGIFIRKYSKKAAIIMPDGRQ
ncbi:MAG: hypothetical protein GF398_16035 [Chitinivibrionales bacterium]|nr:hypothetical protein [Chitinivibrionales bacterium]